MSNFYEKALGIMSETEKNRMVACYLAMDNPNANVSLTLSILIKCTTYMYKIDWKKATEYYGSASIASMKKCMNNLTIKLEQGVSDESPTPAATTIGKRGKKRGLEAEAGAEEPDEDGIPEPSPKKRVTKNKGMFKTGMSANR